MENISKLLAEINKSLDSIETQLSVLQEATESLEMDVTFLQVELDHEDL